MNKCRFYDLVIAFNDVFDGGIFASEFHELGVGADRYFSMHLLIPQFFRAAAIAIFDNRNALLLESFLRL